MSIINNCKLYFILLAFVGITLNAEALSIRVVEGVPVGDYKSMVEEGMRLGNSELLRTAWSHYENAIKFGDDEEIAASSYLELGKIYFYLSLLGKSTEEDFLKAEDYAKQMVNDFPDDSDAHRTLGLIFAGRGAFMDAFDEFYLALKLNPANSLILCDMASLHLALHQPDKTIECLKDIKNTNGWNQIMLAMAYSQKDQSIKAYMALKKAELIGYKGYWLDTMRSVLTKKLGL